ncbi:LysR family transcriptional regulator [Variovorax saccharolyticus]|uniref:LysR family transcriptional regulator n=1 Tax=Variovorax saccharolyticus TaxID=3053516 RepID=UPI00257728AB|nr:MULTISPECIES: LysR substrate-binding domain-containing protein [unclassified Variovorax]MDM0017378.1 LysR substrate-binding domain-containing protein [Variovorax sp. J22R187]MDM0026896.1 LysR substrate-binding domain-containing protein [Variovorax sp. J31P216]
MKPQQLRTFLAVAEHRSIHAAARALFVSQPAVTRTMRELERDLDVPLLRRSISGVELTEAGLAFQVRASLLVEEMRRTREELQFMKEGANGRVAVALTSTVGLTLLPPALESFQRQMPRARVSINEDPVPLALRKLQDGTLDFMVVNTLSGSLGTAFHQQPLFDMSLMVAARRQHPFAAAGSIRELNEHLWVAPGYAPDQDFVAQLFASHGQPAPARMLECESFAIAMHLLTRMDAFALLSAALIEQELTPRGVVALSLREPIPPARISIVTLRNARLTPTAQCLISCLRAQPLPAGMRRAEA